MPSPPQGLDACIAGLLLDLRAYRQLVADYRDVLQVGLMGTHARAHRRAHAHTRTRARRLPTIRECLHTCVRACACARTYLHASSPGPPSYPLPHPGRLRPHTGSAT